MVDIKYIEGGKDLISELDFSMFIHSVSNDFTPPLLQRINMLTYYNKLNQNAKFILCLHDNKIVGMIAFYCNDSHCDYAYVTLLAILPKYRGRGLCSQLLNKACDSSKKNNKIMMLIETNNEYAKQCYIHLGFQLKSKSLSTSSNLIRYYLEKKL